MTDDDLIAQHSASMQPKAAPSTTQLSAMNVIRDLDQSAGASARERALKRVLEKKSKQTVTASAFSSASAAATSSVSGAALSFSTTESDVTSSSPSSWWAFPFDDFCDVLMRDMFDVRWEVRHGAGIALRNIINMYADHDIAMFSPLWRYHHGLSGFVLSDLQPWRISGPIFFHQSCNLRIGSCR